jgi:uncharacterized ion transporter superfamily protein YfcC
MVGKGRDFVEHDNRGTGTLNVYVVFFIIMLFVVVLSWLVPAGEFAKVLDARTGGLVSDPTRFHFLSHNPHITLLGFFQSIHDGIVQAADLIVTLLVTSGVIRMLESVGAIDAGLRRLLGFSRGRESAMVALLFTVFTAMGAVGFCTNAIPFIPLAISMTNALGYDRLIGAAAVLLGLNIGFASGLVNIYTTGIAQQVVGLPLFSAFGFRAFMLAVYYVVTLFFLLRGCRRFKDCSDAAENSDDSAQPPFTATQKLALLGFAATLAVQIWGSLALSWKTPQISAIYLMYAAALACLFRMNAGKACVTFLRGAQDILPASLTVGLGRSVVVLMTQADITDTIVYEVSRVLSGRGAVTTLLCAYLFVTALNFFIVSGSSKAVMLMPVLSPLAKLLGIGQQTMVITYICGDGLTNFIWPCGVLIYLAVTDIGFKEWVAFTWKYFVFIVALGFAMTLIANSVGLGPF